MRPRRQGSWRWRSALAGINGLHTALSEAGQKGWSNISASRVVASTVSGLVMGGLGGRLMAKGASPMQAFGIAGGVGGLTGGLIHQGWESAVHGKQFDVGKVVIEGASGALGGAVMGKLSNRLGVLHSSGISGAVSGAVGGFANASYDTYRATGSWKEAWRAGGYTAGQGLVQGAVMGYATARVFRGLERPASAKTGSKTELIQEGKAAKAQANDKSLLDNVASFFIHNRVTKALGIHDPLQSWAQRNGIKACFAAGTPILIPGGSEVVERIARGDFVLSRDESDPFGPIEAKVVEEIFVRHAPIWHLHIGGQVVRTTGEHPFFVVERADRIPARDLAAGEHILSDDGQPSRIEEVFETGEWDLDTPLPNKLLFHLRISKAAY